MAISTLVAGTSIAMGIGSTAHIVLVHGACHGAWCWFKVKPLLEAAGHRVTSLDMAASGIDGRSLQELRTLAEYSQPLLELLGALPQGEKVLLVGHSLGGMNISLAMEMFPNKICVAVFLTAMMPDTTHVPSYVLDQYVERTPAEDWLDTVFSPYGAPEENLSSLLFGPNFTASKLYQLSSPQDLELAKTLLRPSSLFVANLSKMSPFTKEGYGSVKKVYALCKNDMAILENFQRWLIELSGLDEDEVKVLDNIDHMAMISNPLAVYQCLLEIAITYA